MTEAKTVSRPQLGEWCTVKRAVYRRVEYEGHYERRQKRWKHAYSTTPQRGIYIGYRTVADGETEWIDEVGYVFMAEKHYELWLFVVDPRQKPIYAFPSDIERETTAVVQ